MLLFPKGVPNPLDPDPSLPTQGENKNIKLLEECAASAAFVTLPKCFTNLKKKKKKHTYCQVKLTVPGCDGQLKGGQLHFLPDLWVHLLRGCVNASDTSQLSPTNISALPPTASCQRLRWPPKPICGLPGLIFFISYFLYMG